MDDTDMLVTHQELYQQLGSSRCTCWVAHPGIREETRFQLRCGAHSKSCPIHRESGDPVDRGYDNDLRRHGEAGRMNRPESWYR